MTTSLNTNSVQPAGLPGPTPPTGGAPVPSESVMRSLPAASAGASGASPQPLLSAPGPESGDVLYFLVDSARPTSPQVLPVLNLAPPGFEPPLGFTVPATATAADPRGVPGRTAVPGQHLGSTAPKTPGIELGAQPFVPRISPASAFATPTEGSSRSAPAVTAGTGGVSLQPLVTALAGADSRPYFLHEAGPYARSLPDPQDESPGFRPELVPLP